MNGYCTVTSPRGSFQSTALRWPAPAKLFFAKKRSHARTFAQRSRFPFDLPELVDSQRASFHRFIKDGIPKLLSQTGPITVQSDNIMLELVINGANYQLKAPEDTPRDSILKMKTYSCPLYVEIQLLYKTLSGELLDSRSGEWVLIGHLPIMTKRGHFIINGSPRVIVHQLVRSPGIYFKQVLEKEEKRRVRFYGDIIPHRGVWLRLQITQKGKIEAKLKKSKKVSADLLQNCLQSLERFERRRLFAGASRSSLDTQKISQTESVNPFENNFSDPAASTVLNSARASTQTARVLPKRTRRVFQESSLGLGPLARTPLRDLTVPVPSLGSVPTPTSLSSVDQERARTAVEDGHILDLTSIPEQKALLHIYDKLYRPAEEREREEMSKKEKNRSLSTTFSTDQRFKVERSYKNLFFTFKDKLRYDLGELGRERINTKFGVCAFEKQLTALDVQAASDWLYRLTKGEKSVDDIDNFQNRRVRSSGEFLYTQFEAGIDRLKKRVVNKLQQFVHLQAQQKAPFDAKSHTNRNLQQTGRAQNTGTHFELSKQDSASVQSERYLSSPRVDRGKAHTGVAPLHNSLSDQRIDTHSESGLRQLQVTGVERFKVPTSEQLSSLSQLRSAFPEIKELLSTKPLNGALRELFGFNPLSQYMDQTNPLADITHKRRMSCLGVGGVSRDSAGMAIRGIHPTHYGRICPIETPEGKNAGLVNSLAMYAKINEQGFVETPYYQVVKGQVQHELGFQFFSAKEENNSHLKIAASDVEQSWNSMLATESAPVRVADNVLDLFKKVDSYQVNSITLSPAQMISVATSLIPFLEHNDANRALMGSNMQRQAVPLIIPERPIVGTGLESLVLAESGHILQSNVTGFISYVSADKIVVDSLCCTLRPEATSITRDHHFTRRRALPMSQSRLDVTLLTWNRERSSLGKTSSWRSDFLQHRYTHRSLPCLLPQKRAKATRLSPEFPELNSSQHTQREHIFQVKEREKRRRIPTSPSRAVKMVSASTSTVPALSERTVSSKTQFGSLTGNQETYLDVLPTQAIDQVFKSVGGCAVTTHISFQGAYLKSTKSSVTRRFLSSLHPVDSFDRSNQNTCLTQRALVQEGDWVQKGDILTDCSASDRGELAVGKNILVAYIPWEGYNFEDAIVISERLVQEDVFSSLHIERYDLSSQNVKGWNEYFTNDLPGIPHSSVKHLDELGLPKVGTLVQEGDILVGKMRYSSHQLPNPYERLLFDLFGENNFSAKDSSLYVPKGVHARVIKRQIVRFAEDRSKFLSSTGQSPKVVHVFLGEKRPIQVGDKMSGRHGNKGVVSKILPRQDMPYLPDGTPIDIILNPLGVPSRMNVGQVFEGLLGLAGTYLAQNFKIAAFDELYGVEASQSVVYLKLYQARLQSGQNWLFQLDFPGKTRLIDARSGESFDQWVTVGRAYILKLIHMVNEKIHARATGPYALITQQPLRGRSHKGGQRLGEMEVWALEGFGAAYMLQELLTKKSDDLVGRKEMPSAIVPHPDSILDWIQPFNKSEESTLLLGQPEIFKVLVCELQALCLDVGIYSLTAQSFQRTYHGQVN